MKLLKIALALAALHCTSAMAQLAGCIPSAETDIHTYFVAVDATDRVTFEPGLSSFTVYRTRNGAAEVAYTTPTITEIDATNAPGLYELLVDEDTTISSGNDVEPYAVRITHASMVPVTKELCIARSKITLGESVTAANGAVDASVERWLDQVVAAVTQAGVPEVDVTFWLGGAVATPTQTGVPEVDLTHAAGSAVTCTSGVCNVNVASATDGALVVADFHADVILTAAEAQTAAAAALTAYDPSTDTEMQGYRNTILDTIARRTTITVTDQDTFVIAAGATFDNAYNGWAAWIDDAGTEDEYVGEVLDYVGSSKTVELTAVAPFTIATGDTVKLLPAFLSTPVAVDLAAFFTEDTGEAFGDAVAGSVVGEIVDGSGGSTPGEIADAVWDEAQVGHTTGGSFGELASEIALILADTGTDGVLLAAGEATEIQAAALAALVSIHLDHLLAATFDPASEPGVADALLNELVESDSGVARFTANSLEQAPTGSGESTAAIAEAVWEYLVASCSAEVGSMCELMVAIDAATTNLPSDPADASVVAGLIAALNNLSQAQVQTAAAAALDAENGANFTEIPDLDVLLALEVLEQGACDSGSTTTCVDAGRTEAGNDYWRGVAFRALTGPTGQLRCVVDFDDAANRLTFVPALTAAITTNTYQLVRSEICVGVDPAYTP